LLNEAARAEGKRHAEAYIPTKPSSSQQSSRIPRPHGQQGWACGVEPSSREGPPQDRRIRWPPRLVREQQYSESICKFDSALMEQGSLGALSCLEHIHSMPLEYRLRKHADYQLVYKLGRKQFGKQIAYFAAPRPADRRSDTTGPRVGLTVPKTLGGAVDRNRIKRRMREVVRKHINLLTAPVDVVLHPKRSVGEAEFAALEREVAVIFRAVQAGYERAKDGNRTPAKGSAA
jgi:ribonuclease P protein component